MKITVLFLTVIITLFSGCKSVPEPEEPEELYELLQEEPEEINILPQEEPEETNILSQDEIDIIDEVINHIVTNELRLRKEDLQVCIYDTFFVYKSRYTDSYENDLINSENYIRNNLTIDEKIISSFIKRNMRRRTVDRDVKFKSDIFWQGEPYEKEYLRMLFSNIGFNENNTEALIYVYVDLPTWKFAEYVYLRKVNGVWRHNKSISSQ